MKRIQDLGAEKYVSVTTFKKSGAEVATPVWAVPDGDSLVVRTEASSGKVRRIRNNPKVVVAACDARGNIRGEGVEGVAQVLPEQESGRIQDLLVKKYGILARILFLGSRLRRGAGGTVGIRISSPL